MTLTGALIGQATLIASLLYSDDGQMPTSPVPEWHETREAGGAALETRLPESNFGSVAERRHPAKGGCVFAAQRP